MAIRFAQPVSKPAVKFERIATTPKPRHAGGRPPSNNPKAVLNIRVDADVLKRWKATGPGWQARMNEVLKAAKV